MRQIRATRLVKTPTKRTCGFSCDFHSSIAAGRDTIGDRITVEDAIGTTLVHSVNPSNSWLSINLSTGTRDENLALSVQSPLKALHRACPIHVDSFFHAKRMEGLSDSLAIAHLLRHLTPQVERCAIAEGATRTPNKITKEAARALDSWGTCGHRKNIFTLSPRLPLGRCPRPRPPARYLSTRRPTHTPPRAER